MSQKKMLKIRIKLKTHIENIINRPLTTEEYSGLLLLLDDYTTAFSKGINKKIS